MANSGHLALTEILNCPDVDFLSSPTCYTGRKLGDGYSYFMAPAASVKLHDKLWFDENDIRTHVPAPRNTGFGRTDTLEQTLAMQWRQYGNQLGNGAAGWWMDQWGGWFDDPPLMSEIGRIVRAGEKAFHFDRTSAAQVAVLVDEQTACFRVQEGLQSYDGIVPLGHAGAPVDFLLLDDLESAGPYKLYIFKFCYRQNHKIRRGVDRRIKRRGAWAVWIDAPGEVDEDDKTVGGDNLFKLTGLRRDAQTGSVTNANLTVAGLSGRRADGWVSLYAPNVPPWESLRELCQAAGVHVYSTAGDVIYANKSFLCIHSGTSGRRNITLPTACDVYDVTRGQPVGRSLRQFEMDLPHGATALYFVGPQERWLPAER